MKETSFDNYHYSREMPVNTNVHPKVSFYTKYGKRALDIILSLLALIPSLPIMGIISIFVLLDVGKPIFFPMYRPGKNGKIFRIYKFHDLNDKKDENGNLLSPELRVTKIGRVLRATSLDELPQLFNILKGDMSIIGPRPLLRKYLPGYTDVQMMRHAVRPGLECPPMKERDHPRTWEEQFEDDVWYVENVSFPLDVKMVFGVLKMVFDRSDVKRRSEAIRPWFYQEENEQGSDARIEKVG